jgi:hypothetical protein
MFTSFGKMNGGTIWLNLVFYGFEVLPQFINIINSRYLCINQCVQTRMDQNRKDRGSLKYFCNVFL